MNIGITILYVILDISAIAILALFITGIIKNYRRGDKDPSLQKKIKRTVFILLSLLVIPLVTVRLINYEPNLENRHKRITFYKKYHSYLKLNNEYYSMLLTDPLNVRLNYDYVNTINQYIEIASLHRPFDPSSLQNIYESKRIEKLYKKYIRSRDTQKRNYGFLFLSLHYLHLEDTSGAGNLIDSVSKQYQKSSYYQFVKGKYLAQTKSISYFNDAKNHLINAISDPVIIKEVYNELARLYYYFEKNNSLETLVNNKKADQYLNPFFKRIVSFRNMNYGRYFKIVFQDDLYSINIWGALSSLLILLLWLFYLRKIDIYEPEKWLHTIFTLLLSMCTIYLVYPLHDILWEVFRYYPSEDPFNDFINTVISIGVIEELVKIIPVLLIVWFTKVINEPFDYIYYCSISALGFAFIENLGYIQESSLYNINARALFSTVFHMVLSSIIGYGLALSKYKKIGGSIIFFLIFLGIAALFHGFYDFWLLNEWAFKYQWLTTVFFIICVHIWFLLANNTLNITTFYNTHINIKNDQLKYYLMIALLGVFMLAYMINAFTRGTSYANSYIISSSLIYGYFILYLAFSLSRFEIIRGYIKPFSIPLTILIPRISRTTDYTNMPVVISPSNRFMFVSKHEGLRYQLPLTGILKKRIVIDNNLESYIVSLHTPIKAEGYVESKIVIIPKSEASKLNEPGNILIRFYLIPNEEILVNPVLSGKDFEFAGWALSKRIDEKI